MYPTKGICQGLEYLSQHSTGSSYDLPLQTWQTGQTGSEDKCNKSNHMHYLYMFFIPFYKEKVRNERTKERKKERLHLNANLLTQGITLYTQGGTSN